jgi:quercetin dioxygenase-like cupin family protein
MSTAREAGDVATTLLFENERVKVWEMCLEPGESSDFHRHALEYFFCVIEGESIDADLEDGSTIHLPLAPGNVVYLPAGGAETAVNRSPVRYREILVELKR